MLPGVGMGLSLSDAPLHTGPIIIICAHNSRTDFYLIYFIGDLKSVLQTISLCSPSTQRDMVPFFYVWAEMIADGIEYLHSKAVSYLKIRT